MRLVASLTSPFARKVRMLVLEKGLECPLEVDVPWNSDTAVPRYNPLGKVPVLVLADNSTLYDSRVIAEYLDAQPGPSFIPADLAARIAVRRLEALADGIADAAATIFVERRRPEAQQSPEWIARQFSKIDAGLAALAAELGERDFLVGDRLSLADLAAVSCLGYLELRFASLDWPALHPGLARYLRRMGQRDSVRQTIPPAI